jgi:hypothetical protein
MSLHFKGTTALSIENIQRQWTETNGWESTYSYKGPWSVIEAAALDSAYVGNAARIDVRQEAGDYGVLQVVFSSPDNQIITTPTTEPETDTWTFAPYEVQRNAWESPYFSTLDFPEDPGHKMKVVEGVEAYRNKVRAEMEARAIKASENGSSTPNDNAFELRSFMKYQTTESISYYVAPSYSTFTFTSAIQDKSEELANMLLAGKETYNDDKYTLRNTRVVPANTLLKASTWRKGYQWTTNRLVDLILAQKTAVTKYSICGELLLDFAGTYWLKKAPTITELYNGKFEIASEFINMEAGELPTEFHPIYS